jgi:hypothetical protein
MSDKIVDIGTKRTRPAWREDYGVRQVSPYSWQIIHVASEAIYGTARHENHARLFAAALNADLNRIYADIEAGRS